MSGLPQEIVVSLLLNTESNSTIFIGCYFHWHSCKMYLHVIHLQQTVLDDQLVDYNPHFGLLTFIVNSKIVNDLMIRYSLNKHLKLIIWFFASDDKKKKKNKNKLRSSISIFFGLQSDSHNTVMNNPSAEGLPVVIESSDSFDSGIKSSSRSPSLTSIDRWPVFFSSYRKARPERNFPKLDEVSS
ncbi:hypothetical protein AGLY_009560 [Aphis glycines]|uniref:Uncharacterized protein n=1 Tax=Aphis glycines TaxID=307491 RepID=A0A6G0THY6_APHGL|nr:hypothetical protein AGLY_009560 [Aphis glycines]